MESKRSTGKNSIEDKMHHELQVMSEILHAINKEPLKLSQYADKSFFELKNAFGNRKATLLDLAKSIPFEKAKSIIDQYPMYFKNKYFNDILIIDLANVHPEKVESESSSELEDDTDEEQQEERIKNGWNKNERSNEEEGSEENYSSSDDENDSKKVVNKYLHCWIIK